MLLALLACSLLSQDAAALVDRLRSDDIEARGRAEAGLIGMGPSVVADLRRHLDDRDPEVRTRVARILREFERLDRVRPFWPPDRRLTLELRDEPFALALERVVKPFGLGSNAIVAYDAPGARSRKVSLRLENATLWESFDALCAAAGAQVPAERMKYTYQWNLVDAEAGVRPLAKSDAGNVRIFALPEDAWKGYKDELHGPRLAVKAALPSGAHPTSCAFENAELTDDRGRALAASAPGGWLQVHRHAGFSSIAELWRPALPAARLEGARTLRLRGTLLLRFPHDVARHEVDLSSVSNPPREHLVGGAVVAVSESAIRRPRGWSVSYSVRHREGAERISVRGWIESDRGEAIHDVIHFESGPGMSESTVISSSGGARPRKLVLMEILGEETVTVPFDLKEIPVPAAAPREE